MQRQAEQQRKRSRHLLVVKMFLAVAICFVLSFVAMNLVFTLRLDDRWYYLVFVNNISNPAIYYWLNKEFRKKYNDFWREASKKVRGACC